MLFHTLKQVLRKLGGLLVLIYILIYYYLIMIECIMLKFQLLRSPNVGPGTTFKENKVTDTKSTPS